jgi:hypothetical protein
MTEFKCPRRGEIGDLSILKVPDHDTWRDEGVPTCSWCGSISQQAFLAAIDGGLEVVPTDKTYKAYVKMPTGQKKFYFQHLDEDGRKHFIAAINAKTMKIGYPGHFYRRPFFCAPADKTPIERDGG